MSVTDSAKIGTAGFTPNMANKKLITRQANSAANTDKNISQLNSPVGIFTLLLFL
jgi:hypothetical protein